MGAVGRLEGLLVGCLLSFYRFCKRFGRDIFQWGRRGRCVAVFCAQELIAGPLMMCRQRVRLLKDRKSMQRMMLWCGRRRFRKDGFKGGETHDACNRAVSCGMKCLSQGIKKLRSIHLLCPLPLPIILFTFLFPILGNEAFNRCCNDMFGLSS